MKLSIFVKWICVIGSLSVQCDAFLDQLNASDVLTKVCIQKTINHLFSYDDTLSLILDNNNICEEAIFEMNTTRPYIILNFNPVERKIRLQCEGQFIICPKDALSLSRTIKIMENVVFWKHSRDLGNAKILVITNKVDASLIFQILWSYGINNVIVLFYGRGISKLYMCDRYSPENACGGIVKSKISQNCEEQVTFSFTKVIHQMNKCPITFRYRSNTVFARENENPIARYIPYVIQELSNRINATFQRAIYNHPLELPEYVKNTTNIVIEHTPHKYGRGGTITEPLMRFDIVWLVPKAEQISDMNAFVQVFNWSVWVAVGVTLICTWLTWFLLISWNGRFTFTFEKLGLAFINVWSLSICGCIANFPRSFALRITLLTYLIYVIHIQCALTSNMATILTTPRYGFQIRNLEDLAESGLPIYVLENSALDLFKLNDTDHKLYTQLQKQLHPVSDSELDQKIAGLQHYRNYSVITVAEDLREIEKEFSQKFDVYQICDNSMTGVFTYHLSLPLDHYFAPTLNSIISKMEESGIGDKVKNDLKREHFGENDPKEENSEELTLPHLVFIFVFFGLGLSISCVVFSLEHVVHKFL